MYSLSKSHLNVFSLNLNTHTDKTIQIGERVQPLSSHRVISNTCGEKSTKCSLLLILFIEKFQFPTPIFYFELFCVVYQNNHPHAETTFQNTYITNTHTHMHAHARLLQLRSELISLVTRCMCNVI